MGIDKATEDVDIEKHIKRYHPKGIDKTAVDKAVVVQDSMTEEEGTAKGEIGLPSFPFAVVCPLFVPDETKKNPWWDGGICEWRYFDTKKERLEYALRRYSIQEDSIKKISNAYNEDNWDGWTIDALIGYLFWNHMSVDEALKKIDPIMDLKESGEPLPENLSWKEIEELPPLKKKSEEELLEDFLA